MESGSESNDMQSVGRNHEDRSSVAENRREKPLKRSCNNCRQQKLRCDVIQSPFSACSRCRRLGKTCQVEKEFKRIGKRDKYAKMQCEIDDLRRKLRIATQGNVSTTDIQLSDPAPTATASVTSTMLRKLGRNVVSGDVLHELFNEFFSSYHSFLPFLDPSSAPDHYFALSPLLGWSIVMVAARRFRRDPNLLKSLREDYINLLWLTISEIPQPYHVVKALCLICFWPLPTSHGHQDPTFQISGIMMQIALQNLVHRPIQNSLLAGGSLPESEQHDRLITWTACNIVAQSTSNIYGLPPQTNYSRILDSNLDIFEPHNLPNDLVDQVRISQFCNAVTRIFYCDDAEPSGFIPVTQRAATFAQLGLKYVALKTKLGSDISVASQLHLLAADVHLNAFAFLLPLESSSRDQGFLNFYNATCMFVQTVIDYEASSGTLLEHCSNLISQTVYSSIFALLRLLNSSFASKINTDHGKAIFNAGILAARRMSMQEGDVASRMATRVPQQWRKWGAGAPWSTSKPDRLILELQFRMSVSHGYDCMWNYKLGLKDREESSRTDVPAASGSSTEFITAPAEPPPDASFGLSLDPSYPEFDVDNFNMFASMDWMLGDWMDMPLSSYD